METSNLPQIAETQEIILSSLHASLQPYSPAVISKTFAGVYTVQQALEAKAPSLMRLSRTDGCSREQVEALIMAHLLALDAFLKQKNGLSTEEVMLIAEEVVNTYGYMLTFADINVIFRNAKLGKYGELYGNLSCPKIMKWFEQYASERCNTAEQMSYNADRAKYGSTQGRSGNEVLKSLGYAFDEDGKILINKNGSAVVDHDKLEADRARREAERKRKEEERRAVVEKEAGYLRWKQEYLKNGTL